MRAGTDKIVGPAARQMGYPNQMMSQSQRASAMNASNPMMGRLPNGRSAGVPSWGTSATSATSPGYATNLLQRPPSSGPFPNEGRPDTHQSVQKAAQSFREDDFPALGAGIGESSTPVPGSYAAISNGTTNRNAPDNSSFDDFPSLPGMLSSEVKGMPSINQQANTQNSNFMQMPTTGGIGTNHGTAALSSANLQQHRSSLLGAMTQGRSTPNLQSQQSNNANQNQRDSQSQGQTRNSNPQDPRFGRAINAPPNLSLMNGPPALGGSSGEGPPGALHHHSSNNGTNNNSSGAGNNTNSEEPATPRSAGLHVHTRDRGGDLSIPVPSHAPGLNTSTIQIPQETIQKAKEVAPIEDEEPLTEVEKYTIKGLLPIIRQTKLDASMLALGSDLTNLGFKLAADDDRLLSSLWSSPWTDSPSLTTLPEANWSVPSCYTNDMLGVLPPAHLKIGNFAEETLFYIFYTQPRDKLQEHAAQELTARNWRFHKSLGLWLTKEPGIEPQLRTSSMERGTYVFWDSGRWERVKKIFELYYEDLEDRFSNAPGAVNGQAQAQQQQPQLQQQQQVTGGQIGQDRVGQ